MATRTGSPKGFYLTTFMIGLGFFTMGLMDPLYDQFIPVFLSDYIGSKGLIGTVMTLDNVFALFLIPVVSAYSDRTVSPIGRRMPYILVTLPLSALFFALIPYSAKLSLFALVAAIFCLNIFKSAARGPVVALMPDTIPGELRSEANGVINTMGGIAAIVGTIVLGRLADISIDLPIIGNTYRVLPFALSGVLVVLSTIMVFVFVKEKLHDKSSEKREPILKSIAYVFGSGKDASGKHADRSVILILVSLLFWNLGYQGVLPFLTLYNIEIIKVTPGTAILSSGMFAIACAVFAIPTGIVAHKIGRRRTIRIALVAVAAISTLIYLHQPITAALGFPQNLSLYLFWALLFVFGMFWISIVVNSFPMLWQMASFETVGIYTGLYYTFSQAASIIAPPITGTIIDFLGFRAIFLFAAACMIAAFFTMGGVKSGEADGKASA